MVRWSMDMLRLPIRGVNMMRICDLPGCPIRDGYNLRCLPSLCILILYNYIN